MHAQYSMFEFVYHFEKDSTEYKAFLLRNTDGTGFIRVTYTDPVEHKPVIANMELEEYFDKDANGNPDSTALVISGKRTELISGSKELNPAPAIFLFGLNPNTDEYEPSAVYKTDSVTGTRIKAIDITDRLLQKDDVRPKLVLQYFLKTEPFYVNLFGSNTRGTPGSDIDASLFLIIVANTNDPSIGKTCVIDKENTLSLFKDISDFLEIKFIPKEISGNNYSKKNVDKALAELRPGNKDIVVFYYTGHGYGDMNDNYLFPHLDLRDNYSLKPGDPYQLSMEDIYNTIKAKGARLNLVMSDCCNSEIGRPPNVSKKIAKTRGTPMDWNKNNCISLFLNPKPYSALFTAASKGQESAGNSTNGGIFTFNLTEAIQKYMGPVNQSVGWDQIMQSAQAQTIDRAKRTICPQGDGSFKSCNQIPIAKFN